MSLRTQMRYMNPYDIHKALFNDYILKRPGDTKLLKRDVSRDKTDLDILKENHKFLWDDKTPETWEEQFAKKYYDKLFKEYSIGDLSRYKENKIALRWRTEQEVISGKGQFICAEKRCKEREDLRSWEVNFVYKEGDEKKNVLVKIRLCPDCSRKINYHTKKREIKKQKRKRLKHNLLAKKDSNHDAGGSVASPQTESSNKSMTVDDEAENSSASNSTWENLQQIQSKSREEEMEEYLQDLLL